MDEVKLYRKNSLGIGTWRIKPEFKPDAASLHYSHAVTEGASEVFHHDNITVNGSGRSLQQQVELEMKSRISRMLDKGYKYSYTDAQAGSTNQMGFINPMLAQPLGKVTKSLLTFSQAHVQPKLDGHRCLITNQDGNIIAYTRKGKPITTIGHIIQDFSWLPEGRTVDGELYIHGVKLQSISSLIKRAQADSAKLRYHWYDHVSDKHFADRYASMEKAIFAKPMKHVEVVDTFPITSMDQAMKLFHHFKSLGYEGAMLRLTLAGYEANKRAMQLIKLKDRDDCEVTVLGATPSKDGWAVLKVKMDSGVIFDVTAPGSVPEKLEIMQNIASYIGRRLSIEYAMLTDDGVPFHAVAIRWFEEI